MRLDYTVSSGANFTVNTDAGHVRITDHTGKWLDLDDVDDHAAHGVLDIADPGSNGTSRVRGGNGAEVWIVWVNEPGGGCTVTVTAGVEGLHRIVLTAAERRTLNSLRGGQS